MTNNLMRNHLSRAAFRGVRGVQTSDIHFYPRQKKGNEMKKSRSPDRRHIRRCPTGRESMRKTALVPAAVLTAGVVCASPAHALPIYDWVGNPPTGGMVVQSGGPKMGVQAEAHIINDQYVMHMTASNGCDEQWFPTGVGTYVQANGAVSGFINIRVNAGQGPGCQPADMVSSNFEPTGGGNYNMVVTETPDVGGPDGQAVWILHGHDG
jgi:hypothetical protein